MSTSPFRAPDGTNDLISRHLVTSAEIARRVGVSRAAVANWVIRHPEFASLAIPLSTERDYLRSYVFWWPEAKECLARLGIPDESAKRRGRKPKAAAEPAATSSP